MSATAHFEPQEEVATEPADVPVSPEAAAAAAVRVERFCAAWEKRKGEIGSAEPNAPEEPPASPAEYAEASEAWLAFAETVEAEGGERVD